MPRGFPAHDFTKLEDSLLVKHAQRYLKRHKYSNKFISGRKLWQHVANLMNRQASDCAKRYHNIKRKNKGLNPQFWKLPERKYKRRRNDTSRRSSDEGGNKSAKRINLRGRSTKPSYEELVSDVESIPEVASEMSLPPLGCSVVVERLNFDLAQASRPVNYSHSESFNPESSESKPVQRGEEKGALKNFFELMKSTVVSLSPLLQVEAKRRIATAIFEMEKRYYSDHSM